jgi:hypothetical protein
MLDAKSLIAHEETEETGNSCRIDGLAISPMKTFIASDVIFALWLKYKCMLRVGNCVTPSS